MYNDYVYDALLTLRTHLPDYTKPEPGQPSGCPRGCPPKEEGEAARNNVVMSAGKRSCPGFYLLSVI